MEMVNKTNMNTKYVKNYDWPFSPKRIMHFDFQINNPTELKKGDKYAHFHVSKNGEISVQADREVLEVYPERNYVKMKVITQNGFFIADESLAGLGITDYVSNSSWNRANFLVPLSRKNDLLEIIAEKKSKLGDK